MSLFGRLGNSLEAIEQPLCVASRHRRQLLEHGWRYQQGHHARSTIFECRSLGASAILSRRSSSRFASPRGIAASCLSTAGGISKAITRDRRYLNVALWAPRQFSRGDRAAALRRLAASPPAA